MSTSILVCVVSRDENPRTLAIESAHKAAQYANARGIPCQVSNAYSCHAVDLARNRAVAGALNSDPRPTHLLMVDDDVLIQEDAVVALLDCKADIAGGCYPNMKRTIGEFCRLAPGILVRVKDKWLARWFDGITDATAVAGGCMLIHVSVFEKLGFPWFRWPQYLDKDGEVRHKSDDVDFCDRARELGCTIRAHGNVRCSHLKTIDLSHFIAQPNMEPWEPRWKRPATLAEQMAPPAYGSHLPVLQAIGSKLNGQIKCVVEYGAGKYSTPAFCDRKMFPSVEKVESHESNMKWMSGLQNHIQDDRWHCYYTPLSAMAKNVDPEADLVLIDCDTIDETDDEKRFLHRRQLIDAYALHEHPLVVVHDSNFQGIAECLVKAPYKYRANYHPEHGPDTAVLSNSVDVTTILGDPSHDES